MYLKMQSHIQKCISYKIMYSTRRELSFKIHPENMVVVVQYFKDFYCISVKLIKFILYFIVFYFYIVVLLINYPLLNN